MAFSYELDAKKLRYLIRKYPKALAAALRPQMSKAVRWFRKKHEIARLSGPPGLHRRTGDLVKSFVPDVSPPGTGLSDLASWLATRSRYAQIHEEGGTIKAKKPGGFLAIPLPAALAPTGVLKNEFVGPLRNVPGLFCEKSPSGKLLLWMDTPGGVVPMFVLKKSVDIPPRLRFFDMFRRWAGVLKKRFMEPAVNTAWAKAKKR
jgi:hypothetical protein